MPMCCFFLALTLIAVFVIVFTDIGKDPDEKKEAGHVESPPIDGADSPDGSTPGRTAP